MSDEGWLAEHKGSYIDTVAEVWECGDDHCQCSQAQIVERYQNSKVRGVVRIGVWSGPFHTDGEVGAEQELDAKRADLRATDPAQESRIRWPEPEPDRG